MKPEEILDERARQQLREVLAEGCRDMAEISLELEIDFHPLEEEVHRAIDYDFDI